MQGPDISSFHRLGAAVGLGLTLAASACGTGADDSAATAETATTTDTTGGTTDGTTDGTTGSTSAASTTSGHETHGTTDDTGTSTTTTTTTTGEATTEDTTTTGGGEPVMGVFVTSMGSSTGDLGGLAGADLRCQDAADAVGAGGRTWRAYLSAEKGDDDQPVHARDRIGQGPWYNAALVLVAADLEALHALDGDHTLFLDEHGEMVNGQWEGSPDPNEHDILTGTNRDGTLAVGKTCADWTSEDPGLFAQVGHSDGLGPMMSDAEMYRPWNSVHENGGCHDTAPKGGAGRIYCFAAD